MVKVSIVFPVYNSENFINECLDSLLNQTFKDYELIIIDDCSTDKTTEILDKRKIKYYKNDKNLGFAGNLNKGIKIAKGEYIMIVDHDMIYDKDYLKEMMLCESDIMVGKCYYYDYPNTIRGFGIKVNLLTGKTIVYGRDRYDSFVNFRYLMRKIEAGGGGTLVFKKEIFNRIKFDKEFYKYYVDLDFCYEAKKNRYNIYLTGAKCWHKKQKVWIFEKEELKKYYKDKKRFLKKHSPYYPLCLLPIKLKQLVT